MIVVVIVVMVGVCYLGWLLVSAAREHHRDLGGLHPAPIYRPDLYGDVGEPQARRQLPQPLRRGTG